MIVSVDELKTHLRVLTDDEDDELEALILQAQQAASDFCRVDWENEETVPETVRLAVILMASHFYENRDCANKEAYETMRKAFRMLLYPNQKPEAMF